MKNTLPGISLLVVLALAGCNRQSAEAPKPPPPAPAPAAQPSVQVTDVTLGRSLTPEQTIGDRTESFLPSDTIYVTVKTEGAAPSAVLQARWTYQDGQVIEDTRQTVTPSPGGAITEFHVSKPDGWPAGNYKVEILVDGKLAQAKAFKVS